MQVFLFIIGVVALIAGVATIGYGIPINQFSFGNTLIVVGTIAAIGGLIVIALGALVSQLKQLGGIMAAQQPQPFDRPDAAEHALGRPAPAPFVPKPMPEPALQEAKPSKPAPEMPAPAAPRLDVSPAAEVPVLRNPDATPVRQDAPLAPAQAPVISPPVEAGQGEEPAREGRRPRFGFMRAASREEPPGKSSFDSRPIPPPIAPPSATEPPSPSSEETHFEAAWPAENKSNGAQHEHRSLAPESPPDDVPDEGAPAAPASSAADERPKAAILKSGVVDGMGYTLYVDGSIEAELPQGTLRFASINDLRAHLEKSS